MHVIRLRGVKLGALLLLAAVVMAAVYAFAATNIVPDTRAGDGAGTISGYRVCHVQYTLDSSNPQNLARVEFTLHDAAASCPASPSGSSASASDVRVRLVNPGGTWYTCSNGDTDSDGRNWECATTGQPVAPANELRVVAVE